MNRRTGRATGNRFGTQESTDGKFTPLSRAQVFNEKQKRFVGDRRGGGKAEEMTKPIEIENIQIHFRPVSRVQSTVRTTRTAYNTFVRKMIRE